MREHFERWDIRDQLEVERDQPPRAIGQDAAQNSLALLALGMMIGCFHTKLTYRVLLLECVVFRDALRLGNVDRKTCRAATRFKAPCSLWILWPHGRARNNSRPARS